MSVVERDVGGSLRKLSPADTPSADHVQVGALIRPVARRCPLGADESFGVSACQDGFGTHIGNLSMVLSYGSWASAREGLL